jgi:hypothetical protein
METLELKLDDASSIFVAVEPSGDPGSRRQDVSRDGRLQENFAKVSGSLRAVAETMEAQLATMTRRPDRVQLEMGAQLKGKAELWLVAGEATGHMKITLTWEKPRS